MIHARRLALTGLLALSLTGCGAGLDAYTYQERTVADATNVNVGTLAVRNISILPPAGGRLYETGGEARGVFTVANTGSEADRLVEASSPAASEVVLVQDGKPTEIEVPPRGTTGGTSTFILRGLTADLGTGEFVPMTFRFERSGTIETLVPVALTGRTDRPAKTGEPGSEEGEPALQGPAGGHHDEKGEGAEGDQEGGGEAERGASEEGQAGAGETGSEAEPSASPSTD